jgi:leader peptidase (prepilin peptidase)/N-methyltransferase
VSLIAEQGPRRHSAAYTIAVTPMLRWLVLHHSVPFGTPWTRTCHACSAHLWPAACTPAGTCPACATRTRIPPYTLEATLATAVAVLALSGLRGWELAAYTWWAAGMTVLAFTDLAVRRLPFRLTATTTAGTALILALTDASSGQWAGAILSAAAVTGFYAALRAVSRGGIGLGDIAAAIPIGFSTGWFSTTVVLAALATAHALAVTAILAARIRHQRVEHLPLGPYLAVGAVIAISTYSSAR